jgi:cell division protein FtsI (penicillin-binding protein 3)
MDPRTGELLAIANYPSFNPNEPGHAPAAHRRNRAVTDRFEPGSTVKPFTVAAAIGAGTVRTDQLIDCENGAMEVAEYTIHDSHRFDELTPAQVLAFSSNIGTAKIGRTLGRRGLYRAFRRFGFGEPTGVPLPGETGGILRHHRRWYEMDAATISFGQGMSATTVQLAGAMSALANDGRLMRPVLVKRVANSRNETVEETLPRVRRQVVPRSVARLVGDMLTAVTGPDGTGTEAAIDGYLVAGKTGTAQKADYIAGGYAEDKWLASFVGFVPAQDPRLVIAVVIDEPLIAHYGGTVAGPVFRRVGEAALRHLGVPADEGGEALFSYRAAEADAEDPVPEPEGAEGPSALGTKSPVPAVTRRVPGDGEASVPDLFGRPARTAVALAARAGLVPELEGSGVVVSQRPAPGEIAARGSTVHAILAEPSRDPGPTDDSASLASETLALGGDEAEAQP